MRSLPQSSLYQKEVESELSCPTPVLGLYPEGLILSSYLQGRPVPEQL